MMQTAPDSTTVVADGKQPVTHVASAAASAAEAGEPRQTVVRQRAPVDIRSASMLTVAVLGTLFAMHWASVILIPLMLGIVVSCALGPIVNQLERLLPRALASALLVLGLIAGITFTAYSLSDDGMQFIEGLPKAAEKLKLALREQRRQSDTPIEKVQQAAAQIEQAAKETVPAPPTARGVTRVQVEKPGFRLSDLAVTLTPSLVTMAGQLTIVIFLTFFLLASGDQLRRKIVRLAGPRFAHMRITAQALDEITTQIQRYLLMQGFISALVGVATWLAFWALGMEHAAIWGVLGGVLNLVPYIGALAFTAVSTVAAFLQFGGIELALPVAGVSALLHTVSGHWLTPWLTGRANRMNTVAVFVAMLVFGWLWGVWGLLLGVPILLIVKTVGDHVEAYRGLGELLAA